MELVNNSYNLKPCPFCGEQAELIETLNGWAVVCDNCGAGQYAYDTKEEAADAWNRRAE